MSRILLGLVIDCPLPGGLSNPRLIRAVQALLDFIYLAQYPVHTDKTLALLEDALNHFHDNKDIFVDLGIRDAFNIPKLHFARHYVDNIKLYGTLNNYNTEYKERLHIDLAKDAYATPSKGLAGPGSTHFCWPLALALRVGPIFAGPGPGSAWPQASRAGSGPGQGRP